MVEGVKGMVKTDGSRYNDMFTNGKAQRLRMQLKAIFLIIFIRHRIVLKKSCTK